MLMDTNLIPDSYFWVIDSCVFAGILRLTCSSTVIKSLNICRGIDHFHNGASINYSFVLMLICLSSLDAMRKIQKNVLSKMRPVGPINTNTIEY